MFKQGEFKCLILINLKKKETYHDDHSVDVKLQVVIESPEDRANVVHYLETLIKELIGVEAEKKE